jgi:hypothetical protein
MFQRRDLIVAIAAFTLGSTSVVAAAGQVGLIGSDGVIHACVTADGDLRLVEAGSPCRTSPSAQHNETPLSWNQTGPAGATGATGPAGTFAGTLTSPNGQYSIAVTDTGITLRGPGPHTVIQLDSTGARVEALNFNAVIDGDTLIRTGGDLKLDTGSNTDIKTAGTATYESAGPTYIKGSTVNIN